MYWLSETKDFGKIFRLKFVQWNFQIRTCLTIIIIFNLSYEKVTQVLILDMFLSLCKIQPHLLHAKIFVGLEFLIHDEAWRAWIY